MTRSIKLSKWHAEHPSIVCRQIARVALSADAASVNECNHPAVEISLGQIALREHQLDALLRLRVAMREFGGALLADAVGLGKTYVALAVAREFPTVHILAPATLLPMWRSAIAITESHNITLHSLHRMSRAPIGAVPNSKGPNSKGHYGEVPDRARSLVIIDEAHHLRTRTTARYNNVVAFTANREVLLLTATPVHNRERELRALLALFLGHRADALDHATLARCVIRRQASAAGAAGIPTVREHPAHRLPDNHMVLECLLTLPPPLPVHEGVAASALVRLGLLRAWCSSDAALSDTIRRRQLRGEALLHSLAHGRYPTQRELQSWIVGNDSVQLGFPELLVATASADTGEMLKTLLSHLDGLQALLQLHTRTSMADARRVELLRSLVGTETLTMNISYPRDDVRRPAENEPVAPPAIVAFSQFASTVRALHRALSDLAGIALLTSEGGRIASGAIARHELIATFAPKAHGRPPPAAHERIRLLLTTDLLAEGVNLQDAGVIVHLDLPWTHALRQQRVGRLARMGASHSFVDVHTFEPSMGADAVLRVVAALERKAGLHRQFVGGETAAPDAKRAARLSGADEATQLRDYWQAWLRRDDECRCSHESLSKTSSIATIDALANGWIAAIEHRGRRTVVACCNGIGDDTTTLHRAVHAIGSRDAAMWKSRQIFELEPRETLNFGRAPSSPTRGVESSTASVERAHHQLQQWTETHSLQQLSGPVAHTIAPIQKRALDTLSSRFANMLSPTRATIAPLVSRVEQQILNARGAGAERALLAWTGTSNTVPISEWLAAFPQAQPFAPQASDIPSAPKDAFDPDGAPDPNGWRLIALLLLEIEPEHEDNAQPSAC